MPPHPVPPPEARAWFVIPVEFDPLLAAGSRSSRRDGALEYTFRGQPAAKHALEALGIPHTEVAGVQADGGMLPLNYHLVDGDRLQVIPISSRPPGVMLHPGPEALFIVDNHLGKLATYLRMLGFDCLYEPALDDPELAERAITTGRVLVTRDRRLLMRRALEFGCWVRSREPVAQVRQVLRRYDLGAKIQLFQRCLRCNHPLEAVSKAAVLHRLEPLTRQYYDVFSTCPACNQVYWAGSHYAHMQALAAEILDGPQAL